MTNVFLLSGSPKSEDRFTSSLHCLIENVPAIGQEIVDYITAKAGKSTSRFVEAIDHPYCDGGEKPDFLLRCEDFDIICEHKLESSLGDRQLERYLSLAEKQPRKTYLAFITNTFSSVEREVAESSLYLCPDPTQRCYFCWEEFYSLISQHSEPLAQNFVKYMTILGMKPPAVEKWQDLFICPKIAAEFISQWSEVETFFKQKGARRVASRLLDRGLEVQYPLDWLHLLYFKPSRQPTKDLQVNSISVPYLCAYAWIRKDNFHLPKLISRNSMRLNYGEGKILARKVNKAGRRKWNIDLIHVFEYATPIDPMLEKDSPEMQQLLLAFAKTVFNHIRWAGESN